MHLPRLLTALAVLVAFAGVTIAATKDPVLDLNAQALNAIRVSRTPPPMASHHLAMLHAALFDAVNSFDHQFESYLVKESAPAGASLEAALYSAGKEILVATFGSVANPRVFTDDYEKAIAEIPDGEAKTKGSEWGKSVAMQIIAARSDDGMKAKLEFQVKEGAGQWRPTPPLFRSFTLPQWSMVKPFTLKSCSQFRPPPPPDTKSTAYAVDVLTTQRIGGRDSESRTEDQTATVAFWSDDLGTATPPGHWNIIASTVAREKKLSVKENARLFALLNLALGDAAIGCWETKYFYGYWRPETAIREADKDDNPATEPDKEWIPLMPSPTFPDYVSGHSTFSRCGATILASYFGTDAIPFSTPGEGMTAAVRSFPGFSAAADEVGMSRIFGGIHFPSANFWGQAQGRSIADYVLSNYLRPVTNVAKN
jgi:PAP2 superfamily